MEDTLEVKKHSNGRNHRGIVLILVLMEDTLEGEEGATYDQILDAS